MMHNIFHLRQSYNKCTDKHIRKGDASCREFISICTINIYINITFKFLLRWCVYSEKVVGTTVRNILSDKRIYFSSCMNRTSFYVWLKSLKEATKT